MIPFSPLKTSAFMLAVAMPALLACEFVGWSLPGSLSSQLAFAAFGCAMLLLTFATDYAPRRSFHAPLGRLAPAAGRAEHPLAA